MNVGTIAGGTHAGWRRVTQRHEAWTCECPHLKDSGYVVVNKGYLNKCSCGNPRPN